MFVSLPMPGTWKITPGEDALADEMRWSSNIGVPWSVLQDGLLRSAGSRRQAVVYPQSEPQWQPDTDDPTSGWLAVQLDAGVYATEFLAALDIAVPEGPDRAG